MLIGKLKEIFFGKSDNKKIGETNVLLNVAQMFGKYKGDILVSVFSIVVLIVIFFVFGGNGREDIVKPNANNNFVDQGQNLVNNFGEIKEYDFTEAMDHIGEEARVKGEVLRVFTAKSGVTFLDFCEDFSDCPFSAVIFASDLKKFPDVNQYEREVTITGQIKSYNGKAEIILKRPEQIE